MLPAAAGRSPELLAARCSASLAAATVPSDAVHRRLHMAACRLWQQPAAGACTNLTSRQYCQVRAVLATASFRHRFHCLHRSAVVTLPPAGSMPQQPMPHLAACLHTGVFAEGGDQRRVADDGSLDTAQAAENGSGAAGPAPAMAPQALESRPLQSQPGAAPADGRKLLWVQTAQRAAFTAACEAGVTTFVFPVRVGPDLLCFGLNTDTQVVIVALLSWFSCSLHHRSRIGAVPPWEVLHRIGTCLATSAGECDRGQHQSWNQCSPVAYHKANTYTELVAIPRFCE